MSGTNSPIQARPRRRWRATLASLVLAGALLPAGLLVLVAGAQASGSSTSAPPTGSGARSVCYRAHIQNMGWQAWECNGNVAGTTGQSLRLEALQIYEQGAGNICAAAHVQNIGWMPTSCATDGRIVTVGTTGQSLRMEALTLSVPSGRVCADAHVQNIGWQGYRCGLAVTVGTTGQSLRMEAVSITLR